MKKRSLFRTPSFSIIWLLVLLVLIPPNASAQVDGDVISVAWSPDGTRIVGGGENGLLRIWNTSGTTLLNITGLSGRIRSVDWSPDGAKVVSGGDDETVRVWNSYNGELLATLVGHQDAIQGIDWSPDGNLIASASFDDLENLRIWDANTYQQVAVVSSATLSDIFWSPDSTNLIAAASNGFLLIYDANLGDPTGPTAIDGGYLTARWSSDGTIVAGGDSNGQIHLWDALNYSPIATLTGHTDGVHAIEFSPDSKSLASASHDGTIRIWDVAKGETIQTFPKPVIFTTSISWSPDGCRLAFGGENGTVEIVAVFQGDDEACGKSIDSGEDEANQISQIIATPTPVSIYDVDWSPDGTRIAIAREVPGCDLTEPADFTLQIIDVKTEEIIRGFSWDTCSATNVDWSPDSTKLVSANLDGQAQIWDVETGQVLSLQPRTQSRVAAKWSPDGTEILGANLSNLSKFGAHPLVKDETFLI